MLYNLHLLRVIAALSVVYFHITSVAGLRLRWDAGSRGVDVFFVISGFIIAYIGSGNPRQFLRRRLIRVVPFYWAATLCVFAMVIVAPRMFHSTSASLPHLVTSLLFIPHRSVTGEMHPTLILGWSLNFEMFFYMVFAMALALSKRWSPAICVAAIVGMVLSVHASGTDNAILTFYARPVVLEFCFGIGVFYLFGWCSARRERLARMAALKWSLLVVLVGGLIALTLFEMRYPDVPRYLAAGVPAFFVVSSALLLERVYGLATKNRIVYTLGEASYIIYLIHPYIVFTVLRVVVKDPASVSSSAAVALIVGLIAVVSAAAVALHVWFEKPVMAFLRARLTSAAEPSRAVADARRSGSVGASP